MIYYKTTIHATANGKGTIGVAYRWDAAKTRYVEIGRSNTFVTYPASVRARTRANNICRAHCRMVFGTPRNIAISEQ